MTPARAARELRWTRGVPILVLLSAVPLGSLAVFVFGADRDFVADVLVLLFTLSFYLLFLAPWWPLPGLRGLSRLERLERTCFHWFWLSYVTACSWEILFVIFNEQIRAARDQAWAYAWWAYIDSGDLRYGTSDPEVLALEGLTAVIGVIGMFGLWLWYRSRRNTVVAPVLFIMTASAQLALTTQYYFGQLLSGLPYVNTDSLFDIIFTFGLLNSPWVVMPVVVACWSTRVLALHARAGDEVIARVSSSGEWAVPPRQPSTESI